MMDVKEKLEELIYQNAPRLVEEEAKILAKRLIANGVTVQRWIPASEPPKENGYYWCKYMESKCAGMEIWRCALLYWDDNEWLVDHKRFRMVDAVTHWMPLPEPPKEE